MRIGIIRGGGIARLFLENMMPAAKAYMESNAELGKIVGRMRDA